MFNQSSRYYRIIVLISVIFFYQSSFAQRATTSDERNEDVKAINVLYNQGKWEEGKKKAEEFLKVTPKDGDMRMLLGKYYLQRKKYDEARYELVKSLEYAPANVDAKQLLVTVETETKRYSSAICYVNELLEVNPYWKGLWRKKIELYRIMGNDVEADRLLKRISQIYPEDEELKKDQSYILEQKEVAVRKSGKIDETIEIAKKRVDDKPREASSYLSAIDNYIKGGDYDNALVYAERALNVFPNNNTFVQKKIAILEHQNRYPEILAFLERQMRTGGAKMRSQYNAYVLDAARNARNNQPSTLYGKVFDGSPGNREAFDYVFNDMMSKEQYEEAIILIGRHRSTAGATKDLDMKELMAYRRMGNDSKVKALTKNFFMKYQGDVDLRDAYVGLLIEQAKGYMQDSRLPLAIRDWKEVIQYGDDEAVAIAQNGLYNVYVTQNRTQEAIMVLDDMLLDAAGDSDLMLKKADLYYKEGRHDYAIGLYEQVLASASDQERKRLIGGYNDMVTARVKYLRDDYSLPEAKDLVLRWLSIEPGNQDALLYMINICYQMKDQPSMLKYAQEAEGKYGSDMLFKIKLAEAMNHTPEKRGESWALLHDQVQAKPFHEPLVKTFAQTTEEYAKQLLKEKENGKALEALDTALYYRPDDKVLKYMKGLAFEGLKRFDSAYQYQKFYEPSLLEYEDFKDHLNYLSQRSFKNNIGVSHLRARYGDDYAITSITTVEYSHLTLRGSSFAARFNYAGRDNGKGIQGQAEWNQVWSNKFSTRIDAAVSNKFFAKYTVNAAGMYEFVPSWEAELGIGARSFFSVKNLMNLNLGVTKDINDFRLGLKLSNFLLDSEGEVIRLYSVAAKAQYFMNSPKNYLLFTGSVGNSPDIDLLNNQFYNSFDVFNVMVGGGFGRAITKNIGANIMGSWYNFKKDPYDLAINQQPGGVAPGQVVSGSTDYRNLYNLYFQVNVSF